MDFQLWYDLSYDDSVHNHHLRTVLLMHSYYPVCLTWNVITMSCFSTCYHCLQSLFSVRYYSFDDVLVGRVGLQVITLSLRWCCIPDLHGHCYTDTVLIILDNDLIMTWWFLLLLPIMDYEYLSCQLRRWWISRLQPLMPSELDKQFVSDKWTLEDDDDPVSSLPDLTWLNFVYCNHYCIIVSEHPVCLSVCLSPDALPRRGCLYLLSI